MSKGAACKVTSDENGKNDKGWGKFKGVQRGLLKSSDFDENGKFGENDEFAILVSSACLPF